MPGSIIVKDICYTAHRLQGCALKCRWKTCIKQSKRFRGRIQEHRDRLSQSEALTRNALVDPLLRDLGWDTEDPALVMPEYKLGNGFADYALLRNGKPAIVIEAKKLGTSLDSVASQGISYCISDGIQYFAVTDGSKWDVYETHRPVPIAEKKIVSFDIVADNSPEVCLDALALWRRSVQDGVVRAGQAPLLEPENVTPVPPVEPVPPQPDPVVVAPTPDSTWQTLSEFQPAKGDKPPTEIRFPDGSTSQTRYWADLPAEVVQWLAQQGRLDEGRIPIQSGKHYILSSSPVHPTGNEFKSVKMIGQFCLETNYSKAYHIKNVNTIIEKAGRGATSAQFSVRLPD